MQLVTALHKTCCDFQQGEAGSCEINPKGYKVVQLIGKENNVSSSFGGICG